MTLWIARLWFAAATVLFVVAAMLSDALPSRPELRPRPRTLRLFSQRSFLREGRKGRHSWRNTRLHPKLDRLIEGCPP
jgi:hypothetical protein